VFSLSDLSLAARAVATAIAEKIIRDAKRTRNAGPFIIARGLSSRKSMQEVPPLGHYNEGRFGNVLNVTES